MRKQLRFIPARTIGVLRQRLQDIWDSLAPEDCQSLFNSLPKIIRQAVLTYNTLLFLYEPTD